MQRLPLNLGLMVLALLAAIMLGASAGFTHAEDLPPRPETPTTTPVEENESDDKEQAPVLLGVVTGTVINATTGAPAPGVTVYVGGVATVTDANGNYLRAGLQAGTHSLWLSLEGSAISDQTLMMLDVAPGAVVVQHLFFHELP